jgi:hypothetical protein
MYKLVGIVHGYGSGRRQEFPLGKPRGKRRIKLRQTRATSLEVPTGNLIRSRVPVTDHIYDDVGRITRVYLDIWIYIYVWVYWSRSRIKICQDRTLVGDVFTGSKIDHGGLGAS